MSLRETLREATRELHGELDATLGELQPFSSVNRYSIYLQGMLTLYSSYGQALEWCAGQAQLPGQSELMLKALREDLQSAGANARATDQAVELVAEGTSDSRKWGAAYVLEGSTMGAQMLVRQARQRLPENVSTKFLEALTVGGIQRFRSFCTALDAANGDATEAVAGANAVFRAAMSWYQNHLPTEETRIAT